MILSMKIWKYIGNIINIILYTTLYVINTIESGIFILLLTQNMVGKFIKISD